MSKGRMEAFSDGMLAILITIMVLELVAPHEAEIAAPMPLIPRAFVATRLACGVYVLVAVMWLAPDRRIEKTLTPESDSGRHGLCWLTWPRAIPKTACGRISTR